MSWYGSYYIPYIPETPIACTFLEGGLPYGASYLYPDVQHVRLHIIDEGFDEATSFNPAPTFQMLYVPLSYTGAGLIERLGGGKDHYLLELYEQGGGFWMKGMKVPHASEDAKKTLDLFGWKRGAAAAGMPVWVVMKKAG
jgi:hypothetical protein